MPIIRMRKQLDDNDPPAAWPDGVSLIPVSGVDPAALHAILLVAYANGFGTVAGYSDWWPNLISDPEYDSALFLVAADRQGHPVALVQSWTSGFIKDVAVASSWRGKGVGEALMRETFSAFAHRGHHHVDLKVMADNAAALTLYRRLGMTEAPL